MASLTREQILSSIKLIHEKINIEDLVNYYGLKYEPKNNNELNMMCVDVAHNDRNPSMNFNTEKKKYNCLSCKAIGNWYTFVKNVELKYNDRKLSVMDKLLIGAEVAGIDLNLVINKTKFDKDNTDLDFVLSDGGSVDVQEETFDDKVLAKFYKKTSNYFILRGYKRETLKYFEMGFGVKGEMKDRCVFPVRDINGRLLGWTGRSVVKGEKVKWLHAPTDRFMKGLTLFNIDKAYPHIIKSGKVYVYESVGNLMRAHEAGKLNAVACLGNKMTKQQADILCNIANEVIMCGDPDMAGHEMNMIALDYLYGKVDLKFAKAYFGVGEDGKALDYGDATVEMFNDIEYLDIDEYNDRMCEELIDLLESNFDRDYKIKMPNGVEILCVNELKESYDGKQLTAYDISFFKSIDKAFNVKKIINK